MSTACAAFPQLWNLEVNEVYKRCACIESATRNAGHLKSYLKNFVNFFGRCLRVFVLLGDIFRFSFSFWISLYINCTHLHSDTHLHNVLFMLFSFYFDLCFKMNKSRNIHFHFAVCFHGETCMVVTLAVWKLIWPRCRKPQVYISRASKIERIT